MFFRKRLFRIPPTSRRTAPTTRPALEALEDRCLLSGYSVTDLGTLGGPNSSPAGINNAGEVVGTADTHNYYVVIGTTDSGKKVRDKVYQQEPFLWAPTTANGTKGAMFDIGNDVGYYNSASGINGSGQAVGTAQTNSGLAFLWNPSIANGTSGSLFGLGSGTDEAGGINTQGQVAGMFTLSSGEEHAFLWTPTTANGATGSLIDLGTVSTVTGNNFSYATGINDSGEVVGTDVAGATIGVTSTVGSAAFLYSNGQMIDLGHLGGSGVGEYSQAAAINSYGQVVGDSYTGNGTDAFLWTPTTPNGTTGTMIDLGSLDNGAFPASNPSTAYAINAAGQVVGESATSNGAIHAFLWTPTTPNGTTGSMIDLDASVGSKSFTLYSATGINDLGQIVGQSNNGAVLLTPTSPTVPLMQSSSSTSNTSSARSLPAGQPSGSGSDLAPDSMALSLTPPSAMPTASRDPALTLSQVPQLSPSLTSYLPKIGSSQGSWIANGDA